MSAQVSRYQVNVENVTIGTSVDASDEIRFEEYLVGAILIPATSAINQLSWYGAECQSNNKGQTNTVSGLQQNYLPACDAAGNFVTQTVAAGRAYPLPAALQGYAALKAVGNAAGTLLVSLKS